MQLLKRMLSTSLHSLRSPLEFSQDVLSLTSNLGDRSWWQSRTNQLLIFSSSPTLIFSNIDNSSPTVLTAQNLMAHFGALNNTPVLLLPFRALPTWRVPLKPYSTHFRPYYAERILYYYSNIFRINVSKSGASPSQADFTFLLSIIKTTGVVTNA